MTDRTSSHERMHTVRPRWTWIALVMMVVGLVLIGAGIIAASWAWAIPGLVLLAAGGVAAVYGGFFYDVQGGSSVVTQMEDVKEGKTREFPGAGTMRSKDEVEHDVRERWLAEDE
jgi:predicted membrane channel-forming protein YqfA (hemolysin III family)